MDHPDKADHRSKTLLFIEIGADLFASVAKMILGIISNSSALIAGGLHSISDATNQVFLLIGLESSKKPADKDHPFGYGKERFFWALLSAFFIILFSGGLAIYRGIDQIRDPSLVTDIRIAIIVLVIVTLVSLFNLFFSSKHYYYLAGRTKNIRLLFKRVSFIKEPAAINLWLGDIATFLSNVLVGLSLVLVYYTGNVIYDAITSIIIGLGLVLLGIFLAQDTKKLLVGEAVTPAMYEQIGRTIRSFPEVNRVIDLKTMHLTPNEILINADIDFDNDLNTQDLESVIDAIEKKIRAEIPAATQISIEAERDQ